MADAPQSTFLARPNDIEALQGRFDSAQSGCLQVVHLHAPNGGGKRALISEFAKKLGGLDSDVFHFAPSLIDEEDGVRTMMRMWASLYGPLHSNTALRGKVEMVINAQLPQHTKRTQGWLRAFVDGVKKGGPKPGEDSFQLMVPKDNPLTGLVEVLAAISSKMPVVAHFHNAHCSHSVATWAMMEALMARCSDNKMLMILTTEAMDDAGSALFPPPMLHLLQRKESDVDDQALAPWGTEEVTHYLKSKDLQGNAEAIARVGMGRPAYIAELIDFLKDSDRLNEDLASESLATLYPLDVDEGELEESADDNGKKHAGAKDVADIAFAAALLGQSFPSRLIAEIGGWEQESIDDLLDATGGLFAEDQFSQPFQTWIYRFTRSSWRQGVLDANLRNDDRAEAALAKGRETATFMERFLVPQGAQFISKTARIWVELGETERAKMLSQMAIGSDPPDAWGMTHDLMKFYEDVDWSDRMRRSVYMNLLDRMVQSAPVQQADTLYNEAIEFAQSQEDRSMQAWTLFAGSRLDLRRQDHFRARDRAQDALTLYKAEENVPKVSEVYNHQAMIEFTDGKPDAALALVDKAIENGQIDTPDGKKVLPQIAASSEFIRGLVARRAKDFETAAKHFRTANEIAGNTGQPAIALDAGLNYGEALLLGGKHQEAVDILAKVTTIAQALRNPQRMRSASSLLTQACGALKQNKEALEHAQRTLGLTQQLKLEKFLPIDLYNVGFFTMVGGDLKQALTIFREAIKATNLQRDAAFAKELLFNAGMTASRIGAQEKDQAKKRAVLTEAKDLLSKCLPAAKHAKDMGKVAASADQLANLMMGLDKDVTGAKAMLTDALEAAKGAELKEMIPMIEKKLADLNAKD
jgi:tetratricopeptide (TPR) repeat protein